MILGTIDSSKLKYLGNYGATWTDRGTVSAFNNGALQWGGDRFFLFSATSTNTAYYSLDGISWTSFTLPQSVMTRGITGSANNWVVWQVGGDGGAGATNYLGYTTNLSTYTNTTNAQANYSSWPKNLTYDPSVGKWIYYIYNQSATTVKTFYSSNGTTWTTGGTQTSANALAWGAASGAGRYLNAHYADNYFYTTADGVTYTLGATGGTPSAYHIGQSVNPSNGDYVWGSNTNNGGSNQPYWFWGNVNPFTRNSQYYGNLSLNGGNGVGWNYLGNNTFGTKFYSTTKTWAYTNNPANSTMTLVTGATIDAMYAYDGTAANPTNGRIVVTDTSTGKIYSSP